MTQTSNLIAVADAKTPEEYLVEMGFDADVSVGDQYVYEVTEVIREPWGPVVKMRWKRIGRGQP